MVCFRLYKVFHESLGSVLVHPPPGARRRPASRVPCGYPHLAFGLGYDMSRYRLKQKKEKHRVWFQSKDGPLIRSLGRLKAMVFLRPSVTESPPRTETKVPNLEVLLE